MTGANDNDPDPAAGPNGAGDETGGVLRIRRRDYRPEDIALGPAALLLLGLVGALSGIAIADGRFFAGPLLPILLLGALGFAWFALIRLVNRRTVVLDRVGLERRDGPVPNPAAPLKRIPRSALHGIEVARVPVPAVFRLGRVPRYSVIARLGPPERRRRLILFPRLAGEDEAEAIRDRLAAALGKG